VSIIVNAPYIVSIGELPSSDTDSAKVEQIDVKVVRVLPYDVGTPVDADLRDTDSPLCLEEIEDYRAYIRWYVVNEEFALRHFTLLMLAGCLKVFCLTA